MLRLLLAMTIVVLPNALRFAVDTGIPGVNLTNLLFLALCFGLLISGSDPLPMRRGRLTSALIGLVAILLMGFVIAQWTRPIDFAQDFTMLKNWAFYPLFYFVYRRSRQDLRGTRQLILLTLVVAVIAGIEAIQQGLAYGITNYSPTERATGPFGDYTAANRAGVFFVMFLPMLLAAALFYRERLSWRIAATVGGVLLILAIMVTYSRQAYLIALLGIFLLLLRRNAVLTVLAVGLLAVSAITALTTILPESVTERVMQTQQATDTGSTKLDTSTTSRFYIWEGAVRMWRDNPAGVGLNRFREYIGHYTNRPGVDAHNSFVLILAECGPLGLLALLWLLWRLWELAGRMRLSAAGMDGEARALALGFTLMVVSMALGNSFSSFLFDGSVMANFWIMCGLLERYTALREHAMLASEEETPAPASIFDRFPLAARIQPGHRPRGC